MAMVCRLWNCVEAGYGSMRRVAKRCKGRECAAPECPTRHWSAPSPECSTAVGHLGAHAGGGGVPIIRLHLTSLVFPGNQFVRMSAMPPTAGSPRTALHGGAARAAAVSQLPSYQLLALAGRGAFAEV